MMVTDRAVNAREVGNTFAGLVQSDPVVAGVWVRKHRDVFELWVSTDPINLNHERALHAKAGTLHDAFPNAYLCVHLLNPTYFEGGEREAMVAEELPADAELIC